MEETTLNQEQATTTATSEDDGFFDDITDNDLVDTPVDGEEEVNAELGNSEESQEETKEEPINDDFLNIRYNKEDVHLNRDQAIEYAQKGMNYDKLNERYTGLNSNLERLANANGLTVDEYLNRLEETQFNFEVSKEMDNLKQQHPDTNEEVLQRLAEQNVNSQLGEIARERQTQFEEQQVAEKEAIGNDVRQFQALYPNVNIRELPKEVWDTVDSGESLVFAYGMYRNKQAEINKPLIEAKQRAQQLNAQNQVRSIGSTTNVGSTKQDDFLSGWNSED